MHGLDPSQHYNFRLQHYITTLKLSKNSLLFTTCNFTFLLFDRFYVYYSQEFDTMIYNSIYSKIYPLLLEPFPLKNHNSSWKGRSKYVAVDITCFFNERDFQEQSANKMFALTKFHKCINLM